MDKIGMLALHLYEELPLAIWKMNEHDLELISRQVGYLNGMTWEQMGEKW